MLLAHLSRTSTTEPWQGGTAHMRPSKHLEIHQDPRQNSKNASEWDPHQSTSCLRHGNPRPYQLLCILSALSAVFHLSPHSPSLVIHRKARLEHLGSSISGPKQLSEAENATSGFTNMSFTSFEQLKASRSPRQACGSWPRRPNCTT